MGERTFLVKTEFDERAIGEAIERLTKSLERYQKMYEEL